MFQYIFLVLVLTIAGEASAKRPLVTKPGSCITEDRWHPITGEKLGKRVRCGV